MPSRIIISQKVGDARAENKKRQFNSLNFSKTITDVVIVDSYTIDKNLNKGQLEKVANVFTNPHLESFQIGSVAPSKKFNWLIEIGFLPGVTDNVGTTARETIEELLQIKFKGREAVYSSQIFFIEGDLSKKEAEALALTLYNPLIQRMRISSKDDLSKKGDLEIVVPKVNLKPQNKIIKNSFI